MILGLVVLVLVGSGIMLHAHAKGLLCVKTEEQKGEEARARELSKLNRRFGDKLTLILFVILEKIFVALFVDIKPKKSRRHNPGRRFHDRQPRKYYKPRRVGAVAEYFRKLLLALALLIFAAACLISSNIPMPNFTELDKQMKITRVK